MVKTELRNMFNNIFRKQKPPESISAYKMLNDYSPQFSSASGSIYDNQIVNSCVDAIARNGAKLKAQHILQLEKEKLEEIHSNIEYLLQIRPNQYMNAYDFLYKVISQLFSNNNAFIYIDTFQGKVSGFYPINYSNIEFVEYQNELYASFSFATGLKMTVPYSSIAHLRRKFNRDDIFGESDYKNIKPTLDLVKTINQGISNAIRSSANIRGLLKFSTTLRPEDIETQVQQFKDAYLSIGNNGGIAGTDAKAEFIPLDLSPKMADDKQMNSIKNEIYDSFGINENIIQNKFTEDEWNAFYTGLIEPMAIQLSLEITTKCFTPKELEQGHRVVYSASRLNYASLKTKTEMSRYLLPTGVLTINEMREMFELEPVEGGEKRLISLNYVDAKNQNLYQTGEVNDNDENSDNEPVN